jgi:hypothetical protein
MTTKFMSKYLLLLPILMTVASGTLWAQSNEIWFNGGASILENTNIGSPNADGASGDVHLGSGFRFGVRFDFNSTGHIGHEFQYAYNRTYFTDSTGMILPDPGTKGMAIHQFGYNVLYYVRPHKEDIKVRPFVTAGFHLNDFALPRAAMMTGGSVRPGGNVGAGFKAKLSPLFGFRFDVRQNITTKPNWNNMLFNQKGPLSQTEVSAGIGVYF